MNKTLLFTFFILSLLINSCEKKLVDEIPHVHQLYIKFLNQHGKNLLDALDINTLKNSITVLEDKEGNKILYSVNYLEYEGRYLQLQASSMPGILLKEMNYSIKSKEIFGDENTHTIHSTWAKEKNNAVPQTVTVDGKILERKEPKPLLYMFSLAVE